MTCCASYKDDSRVGVQSSDCGLTISKATTSRVVYQLNSSGHLVQVIPERPVLQATQNSASVGLNSRSKDVS